MENGCRKRKEEQMKSITAMYFSPTQSSKKLTETVTEEIAGKEEISVNFVDLTNPATRNEAYFFEKEDILVLGYPVYGGRVPGVLQEVFGRIKGDGTRAIVLAVYGNRDYEDALIEGRDLLTENGFSVIAAAAFIGEHSYSEKVAIGRPDAADLRKATEFGSAAAEKIADGKSEEPAIKGNRPYKDPMPDMPFAPKLTDACTNCGICADLCPMGIIDRNEPSKVKEGCILCCACVKNCPQHAKYWDAEPILKIKEKLETYFTERKEPELFL